MKKILSVALIIVLALCLSVGVLADDAQYKATANPEKIVVDGVVEAEEWGEPTFTTTPDQTLALQAKGWDFWSFIPATPGQSVEFYITNDTDYVYCAGKLINAEKDFACPSADLLWRHPHMTVTFGSYIPGMVCPQIEFQGAQYELYTCYTIGMVAGKPFNVCTSQGITVNDASILTEDDFNITYDDATKTYHYEMRIPLNLTTLDIWNNDTVCLGLDFTDAFTGGDAGNRYLISKAGERGMAWFGPNNFYFQTSNPLIIKLNDVMSLRNNLFTPEKLIVKSEIEPLDADYYENYDMMTTTAICAAVAALFAAAAAVVVVIKKAK